MEEKLFDADFWNSLQRLRLAEGQRVNGGRSGARHSTARGSSVEFADFREYVPGDDVRRVDWNAYGRTDQLFVKLFMQEQEGIYTVIVDTSASMNYGTPTKARMAARLAGAFGYMALHAQDRVRLASIQASHAKVESGLTGIQSLRRYLTQVERMEFAGQTDLWNSIRRIPFPRRGGTIVLSDFMDRKADPAHIEQIAQVFRYLQFQRQDIILVRIVSEEEQKPTLHGTLTLVDEETEEELKVTMTEGLLREYQKQVTRYRLELQKLAKQYQARWMEISNVETMEQIIHKGLRNGSLV